MENDNEIIDKVLQDLRNGDLSTAYKYKQQINDICVSLYNKPILPGKDIILLGRIIVMCNITYNDTDKELLIVEDGFYDLLLEKYKLYNPTFQVGAEVIRFKSSTNENKVVKEPEMREVLFFEKEPSNKDYFFKDDIVIDSTKWIDERDFNTNNIKIDESYVTKRHHDTTHNHPELVGTLDKCKFTLNKDAVERGVFDDNNVKTVERDFFGQHLDSGIINETMQFDIVLELKYDGISVEADCTDEIVSARSRGDTGAGKASDLTPILKGYKFPHRNPNDPMVGVKFEAIITQNDLPFFNKAKGYEYKNCRSAIVGLLSSSDAYKYRDFITLVPLAVESEVYRNQCNSDRLQEIDYLNNNFVSKGCPLRHTVVRGTYIENLVWIDIFAKNAEAMRSFVPFMYDGIVASYRDENIRQKLGRVNYVNKYSIAVKFNPLRKQTIFRGYSYTIGQDGSVTPMIHYDPVEFYGTIHGKSSGHSYARFQELKLRLGDIIDVEYVNDVMPYVSKPFCDFNIDNEKINPLVEFPTVCPVCGGQLVISDSGKSVKCINPECGGRQLSRMVNTCAKLGLDGFGEATIDQLGYYHIKDMIEDLNGIDDSWQKKLRDKGFGPTESVNIMDQIEDLLSLPLKDSHLLGSIGFTGISDKTWELILPKITYQELRNMFNMIDPEKIYYKRAIEYMSSIKGIGPVIADTIAREFKFFQDDIDYIIRNGNVIQYQPLIGKKVKLTGTRDKQLIEYLISKGFIVDPNGTVTKDTDILVVPMEGHVSEKTKRAQSYGVLIVPMDEIIKNTDKYL